MEIEAYIVDSIVKNIDLSEYKSEIKSAIGSYFNSEDFKESIIRGMEDVGVGFSIGCAISDKIISMIDEGELNFKIDIGNN